MDKLSLPLRYKGVGLTQAARIGPIVFYSSLASSHTVDPDLAAHKGHLKRFCLPTHKLVSERIGPPAIETTSIENIFPRDQPLALIDNTFYVELFNNEPALKLQKLLSMCAHAVAARNLIRKCSSLAEGINESDMVAAHSNSSTVYILTAPLSNPRNRIPAAEFVAWMRFFLRIPQLVHLGNAKHSIRLGYSAEVCFHNHSHGCRSHLDLHGNHANSGCPSAAAGRSMRHSLLKWAVYYAGQEAGCEVQMEPKTQNLLLGQYSGVECRALFPKRTSKAIAKRISDVKKELEAVNNLEPGPERGTRQVAVRQVCRMMHNQYETKGLRIDVRLLDPHTLQERWVDTTCIHSTCKTRLQAEMKHSRLKIKSRNEARQDGQTDLLLHKPGAGVKNQTTAKHKTYAPLIAVARKQFEDKKRHVLPQFIAAVTSSMGEFGLELVKLQEWLCACYSRKLARLGPRDDGTKIATMSATFRNKFRYSIYAAVARGQARMLLSSGLPAGSTKKGLKKVKGLAIMAAPN